MANRKFELTKTSWSELRFNEAGTWPLVPKLLVYALVLLIGFLLVYWLLAKPKFDDKLVVEGNIDDVQEEIEDLKESVRLFEDQEEKVLRLRDQLAKANALLPLRQEQPDLIDNVNKNAIAADLNLKELRPGKEQVSEQFFELPIEIRFEGTYFAIGEFMARVSSMERLVVPTNLDLQSPDGGLQSGKLSGTLQFKTFRFRPPTSDEGENASQGNNSSSEG